MLPNMTPTALQELNKPIGWLVISISTLFIYVRYQIYPNSQSYHLLTRRYLDSIHMSFPRVLPPSQPIRTSSRSPFFSCMPLQSVEMYRGSACSNNVI